MSDANQRYIDINKEFPFTPPPAGELNADRFERYLRVRGVVESAMTPAQGNRGLRRLLVLTSLPGEVSRVHVQALRDASMSIEEYRWITRQVYTTLVGEPHQPDAD